MDSLIFHSKPQKKLANDDTNKKGLIWHIIGDNLKNYKCQVKVKGGFGSDFNTILEAQMSAKDPEAKLVAVTQTHDLT